MMDKVSRNSLLRKLMDEILVDGKISTNSEVLSDLAPLIHLNSFVSEMSGVEMTREEVVKLLEITMSEHCVPGTSKTIPLDQELKGDLLNPERCLASQKNSRFRIGKMGLDW